MDFHALNESSSSEDEHQKSEVATREAQEEEAFSLYNTAMKYHYDNDLQESDKIFKKILKTEFLIQASLHKTSDDKGQYGPALNLKYLVLKNLGIIAGKQGNFNSCATLYLKALDVDPTDANVWYHAGKSAVKAEDYHLAQMCFEEALSHSPNHWPSLDYVISLSYTLDFLSTCLYYISQALILEPFYVKGRLLKELIFEKNQSLETYCSSYFHECPPSIYKPIAIKKEEKEQILNNISALKNKIQPIFKQVTELPSLKLSALIKDFTWSGIGEAFINTYDRSPTSLSCPIDLSDYMGNAARQSEDMTLSGILTIQDDELCMTPLGNLISENNATNGTAASILPTDFLNATAEDDMKTVPQIYSDAPLGNRKLSKRKRSFVLPDMPDISTKRRSTRVRQPLKRSQDNVNYQEVLQQFLPPRLTGKYMYNGQSNNGGIHCKGKDGLSNDNPNAEGGSKDLKTFLSLEKDDAPNFLSQHADNDGLIDLLYKFVTVLGMKSDYVWPKMLRGVYAAAFIRLRNHITLPDLLYLEDSKEIIKAISFAVLTFGEFKVDQWYRKAGHSSASPEASFSPQLPSDSSSLQIGPDAIGKNFHSDMEYLLQMIIHRGILDDQWLNFTVRALWLKAKFHSVEGEMDLAVSCMERLSSVLEESPSLKTVLANSQFSNIITLETVQQQLESLQRCQSLEEVQKLYDNSAYQAVVDLVVTTFGPSHNKIKVGSDVNIPERYTQLILLHDSLWKLKNHEECVKWTEVAFNESIQEYMNAAEGSKAEWRKTIAHLLCGLDSCTKINQRLLMSLDDDKLVQLTQNLILIICLQMDSYENIMDTALVVYPWIMLYHLIQNEEAREKSGEIETCMPSSFLLLITAHDCLGRRSQCCVSDALLLVQTIEIFMEKLHSNSIRIQSYREDLENAVEQAFYCMYCHPNKKTKAKHLQDHNAQPITLTWQRAFPVYQYFKPHVLPEFDSYRTSTISAEVEVLLKRLVSLAPPELDASKHVDTYTAYIDGATDEFPKSSVNISEANVFFRDLYYLLADYYFKNKEFNRAIKYYHKDICFNPNRVDSWAGMALSRTSQLDQKLNSYEVKNESAIWRKSTTALRCFEHSLLLNPSCTSLWIEYGSLAYVLHSHASRQLRLNTYFDGSKDLLVVKKKQMLILAERCFKEANKTENDNQPEEAWLHHYMLGKIAQKTQKSPRVFLDHYVKSLQYLHEDGARYPSKIQYHNPPELSIEVLEVFYRIHATCLKYLCKYECKGMCLKEVKIFQNSLAEVSQGPFALLQEKEKSKSPSVSDDEPVHVTIPAIDTTSTLSSYHHFHAMTAVNTKISEKNISQCNNEEVISKNGKRKYPQNINEVNISENISETMHFKTGAELGNCNVCKIYTICTLCDTDADVECILEDIINSVCSQFHFDEGDLKPETNEAKEISNEFADKKIGEERMQEIKLKERMKKKICENAALSSNSSSDIKLKANATKVDLVTMNSATSSQLPKIKRKLIVSTGSNTFDARNINCNYEGNINSHLKMHKNHDDFSNTLSVKNLTEDAVIKTLDNVLAKVVSSAERDAHLKKEMKQNISSNTSFEADRITRIKNSRLVTCLNEEGGKCVSIEEIPSEEELRKSIPEIEGLIAVCIDGLRECLKRFIQHYKALYRIAHYYCHTKVKKNFQWSREILLAATPATKTYSPMPGLFAERKNTNFFNGIWRAPSNEIDRPGSFGAHMYRSVRLLIEVLTKQTDYNMLLFLTQQLHRTPDLGKKYMRDAERISLTRQAYDCCLTILRDQMNSLLQEEPPPEESRLTCCLLEIYRTFQALLKAGIYINDTNELLEEAYTMYKLGEVDRYPSVVDQAVMFCQHQLGKSYQINYDTGRVSSVQKQIPVVTDVVPDTTPKAPLITSKAPLITPNLFAPEAWQRGKQR